MPKDLLQQHEQETEILETNHRAFVAQVVETGLVWFLENPEEGVAISSSNDYEDLNVIPFWSDKAQAKAAAQEDWSSYAPASVALELFLEFHVVKTSNEDILLGTNWNQNMFGKEIHPVELALEIIEELKAKNKTLTFQNYADLAAYEKVTVEAYEYMMADGDEDEPANS